MDIAKLRPKFASSNQLVLEATQAAPGMDTVHPEYQRGWEINSFV